MNSNEIQNFDIIEPEDNHQIPEDNHQIPDRKFVLVGLRILLVLGVSVMISQFFVLNKFPPTKS